MATNPETEVQAKVIEAAAPSFFVDAIVGSAWARGVHRVLFAEIVVDPVIGAQRPGIRHNVSLLMTPETVRNVIEMLQNLPGIGDSE